MKFQRCHSCPRDAIQNKSQYDLTSTMAHVSLQHIAFVEVDRRTGFPSLYPGRQHAYMFALTNHTCHIPECQGTTVYPAAFICNDFRLFVVIAEPLPQPNSHHNIRPITCNYGASGCWNCGIQSAICFEIVLEISQ
jgi:hypothetical protein